MPEKTATLTCKITLPDSPHPVIVSKNPGFQPLYLAGRNEFRFFRLINTFFFIFGCWLLPEKFSFCPKNTELPESGGAAAPPAPLARTPMPTEKWPPFYDQLIRRIIAIDIAK